MSNLSTNCKKSLTKFTNCDILDNVMHMKSERCLIRSISKKIVDFCIFPAVLILCLTFSRGSYYERNIYYKLDDITIEIGEKIPEDIINNLGILGNSNYKIETNAIVDDDGNTTELGEFSYYLVYDDIDNKFSKTTNIKAKLTVIDTVRPTITINENNTFDYGSSINAEDIATCYDLSGCKLSIKENINTNISGEIELTILAEDGDNNKDSIKTKITIKERPKPIIVYQSYYSSSFDSMNNHNNYKNSLLTEEEKINLRNNIVSYSMNFIGNPYIYGGTSLTNGTDCSGFTMSIYGSFDYQLPRVAVSQMHVGTPVSYNELLPGDLIVYYYGHVGIYVGNGMMVHAGTVNTGIVMAPIFAGDKTYRRIIY